MKKLGRLRPSKSYNTVHPIADTSRPNGTIHENGLAKLASTGFLCSFRGLVLLHMNSPANKSFAIKTSRTMLSSPAPTGRTTIACVSSTRPP